MLYFSIYSGANKEITVAASSLLIYTVAEQRSEVQLQDKNNTRQTHKYDNKDKYNWFYLNY